RRVLPCQVWAAVVGQRHRGAGFAEGVRGGNGLAVGEVVATQLHGGSPFTFRYCHSGAGRNRTSLLNPPSQNSWIQIAPSGILAFDQSYLPGTLPALERLFTQDRRFHRRMKFVPNQRVDAIAMGITLHHIVLVLPAALDQIAGDADIENAVLLARQHVDAGLSPVHGPVSE